MNRRDAIKAGVGAVLGIGLPMTAAAATVTLDVKAKLSLWRVFLVRSAREPDVSGCLPEHWEVRVAYVEMDRSELHPALRDWIAP